MLRIDDRLVRADQRVDVLEEDDPRRDLVRPGDLLRLLLVLAEVPRGVEELLRDDRRAEPSALERHALARLVGAATLEVRPQVGHVQQRALVPVDPARPAVGERYEASQATTSSAFRSGGKTG